MTNSHLVSQCLDVLDPVPWGILQEDCGLISLHSFLWRHSHQDHIHKLAIGGRLCWGGRQEADGGAGTTWLPTLFHNSHLQLIFLHLSIVSRWEMWYPYHWADVIFKSTTQNNFFVWLHLCLSYVVEEVPVSKKKSMKHILLSWQKIK